MSRECNICTKTPLKGKKVTLIWGVKYRSIRHRKPNLRNTTLLVDGVSRKVKICAKCLKSVKNDRFSNVKAPQYVSVDASTETKEAEAEKKEPKSKSPKK